MKSRMNLNQKEIDDIINAADACSMAMVDENNTPYAVMMNFGYKDGVIYLHSAPEGKKLEILKQNPKVCLSFSSSHQMYIQSEKIACSFSMKYRSVLMHGEVEFFDHEDLEEKKVALDLFMEKYAPGKTEYKYGIPALKNVFLFKVKPHTVEGKAYGY